MTDRKLGKKPARHAIKLQFADYLDRKELRKQVPPHPDSFGHELALSRHGWGMLGNDKYGDCVWAGAAHETRMWTYEKGQNTWFTDKSVLQDYSDCTGFDPNKPDSDVGTDMEQAAKYRRDIGILDGHGKRHKIRAFLAIAPGDLELHLASIYLFGTVGIGVVLPASALDQNDAGQPWDVVSGSKKEGGHYIPGVSWRHSMINTVTWGGIQPMTPRFLDKYNDESVAYLTDENLVNGKSPEAFDYATLEQHLKSLA